GFLHYFFQAEDGIRAFHVTGVQTCALPIFDLSGPGRDAAAGLFVSMVRGEPHLEYLTHPEARPTAAQIEHWADLAVTTFLRAYGDRKSVVEGKRGVHGAIRVGRTETMEEQQ